MMGVHFAIFYLNADGTADPSTGRGVTLRHLDHLRRPIPRPAPWRCRLLRRNARGSKAAHGKTFCTTSAEGTKRYLTSLASSSVQRSLGPVLLAKPSFALYPARTPAF